MVEKFGRGKFGEFDKSSMIHQTKPYKLVLTINDLLAALFICQTLCAKLSEKVNSPNNFPTQPSH